MGADVELVRVEQLGTSPRRRRDTVVSVVADPDERLTALLMRVQHGGRTPMLARVDPIKDLELVPADMPQLLDELDVVLAQAATPAERDLILAVRTLAAQCQDERSLRLRFVGD